MNPCASCCRTGIVAKPPGDEITLLDLATQHSGLPAMPDNFKPADMRNPYADYHAAHLYAYMAKRGVARPAHPRFFYSNLGLGLLGQALAHRAGTTYADLVKREVTVPLGMRDTVVALSAEQRERFIAGTQRQRRPQARSCLGPGCTGRSRRASLDRRRHAHVPRSATASGRIRRAFDGARRIAQASRRCRAGPSHRARLVLRSRLGNLPAQRRNRRIHQLCVLPSAGRLRRHRAAEYRAEPRSRSRPTRRTHPPETGGRACRIPGEAGGLRKGRFMERAAVVRRLLDHAVRRGHVSPLLRAERSGIGAIAASPDIPARVFVPAIGLLLPVPDRVLSATAIRRGGCPGGESRAASVVAVVLVLRLVPGVEWTAASDAGPTGAARVDRPGDLGVRSRRCVPDLLFPHAAQDCRAARHLTGIPPPALAAAIRQFARNRRRAILCPHLVPQPPASRDSIVLPGNCARPGNFHIESSGSASNNNRRRTCGIS